MKTKRPNPLKTLAALAALIAIVVLPGVRPASATQYIYWTNTIGASYYTNVVMGLPGNIQITTNAGYSTIYTSPVPVAATALYTNTVGPLYITNVVVGAPGNIVITTNTPSTDVVTNPPSAVAVYPIAGGFSYGTQNGSISFYGAFPPMAQQTLPAAVAGDTATVSNIVTLLKNLGLAK